MGIIARVTNFVTSRRFSMLDYSGYAPGVPAYSARNYETLAKEGYSENAVAFACIDALTTAMSSIKWKVERPTGAGDEFEPVPNHPILELLDAPNPEQTATEFLQSLIAYLLIAGDAYPVLLGFPIQTEQPVGDVKSIVLARPDRLRPIPDDFGYTKAYILGMDREGKAYDASRVIHLKFFNPLDPLFGLSPLAVAGKDVDVLNAATNYIYRLMARNGRPDGVIITEGALKGDQFDRLQKQVDEKFNNSNKPGGWKLFEGVVKDIKEFAFKPSDMAMDKTTIERVRNVCAVFKVPPEILGLTDAKTYANYGEARTALYAEGVCPLVDKAADKLTQRFRTGKKPLLKKNERLTYDRSKIEPLQEDKDKQSTRGREEYKAGLITANEYRGKNGYKPSADPLADVRMIPMAVVPADDYEATTAPGEGEPDAEEDDLAPEDEATAARNRRAVAAAHAEAGILHRSAEALTMIRGSLPELSWRAFDNARVGYLKAAREIFDRELKADYKACAEAIANNQASTEAAAQTAVRDALEARRGAWQKAYKKVYMSVGLGFAEKVDKGLEDTIGKRARTQGRRVVRAAVDAWTPRIANYLNAVGGAKINDVSNTTRRRIMRVVADSYAEGNGADQTAAAVASFMPKLSSSRALTIARTEVIAASNAGSDAAARSFGVPLVKDWLATYDGRARADHEQAGEDQRGVSLDAPFTVGGASLAFPGDSGMGAPPEETINCRCAVAYEVAGA